MKIFSPLLVVVCLLVTGCVSTAVENSQIQATKEERCQLDDLRVSSNFIDIKGDLLQGITLSNISDADCVLNSPPKIVVHSSNGANNKLSLFNIIPTESEVDPALVTLPRDGGNKVFTILWVDPCNPPKYEEINLELMLDSTTSLNLPKIVTELPKCKPEQTALDLIVSNFTSPP